MVLAPTNLSPRGPTGPNAQGLREAFAKFSAKSALEDESHLCGGEGEDALKKNP